MIKVSVLYPNSASATFDMAYYTSKHKPTYIAVGHLTFDSVEAFQKSFGPNAAEILADIPNYTNTKPVIQISDVKL